jgi:hypothetical protein
MSRDITGGTINPHDIQQKFSYNNQLYDRPAIDSQINMNDAPHDESQENDSHPFDEINFDDHPLRSDSEYDNGDTTYDADDDNDDDDSLFAPSLGTRQLDDDMSLNNDDEFFDEEELPSLYLRLMHRYDEMKNKCHIWLKNPYLNAYNIMIPKTFNLVHAAISNYHVKTCSEHGLVKTATIEVECNTTAIINGHRYRCAADYRGHKWYDWAMLRFPKTVDSDGGSVCVGRIMGIFRYKSAGVFTYGMIQMKGYHVDEVMNSYMVDETVYMVVHCSDDDLTMRQIRNNVVVPFRVTDLTQVYILPVSAIQGPAIVIPDFITETELSSTDFFAVCPRRMLGHYFRSYCREENEEFEVVLDKEDRFDSDNEEFIIDDTNNNSYGGSSEEEGYFDESDEEEEEDEEKEGQEPYGDDESQDHDTEMYHFDDDADGEESVEVYYDSSEDEHANRIVEDEHGNRTLWI